MRFFAKGHVGLIEQMGTATVPRLPVKHSKKGSKGRFTHAGGRALGDHQRGKA